MFFFLWLEENLISKPFYTMKMLYWCWSKNLFTKLCDALIFFSITTFWWHNNKTLFPNFENFPLCNFQLCLLKIFTFLPNNIRKQVECIVFFHNFLCVTIQFRCNPLASALNNALARNCTRHVFSPSLCLN